VDHVENVLLEDGFGLQGGETVFAAVGFLIDKKFGAVLGVVEGSTSC